MTPLEEAKAHLATYGAQHVDCCGTPILRKVVAEMEAMQVRLDRWEPSLKCSSASTLNQSFQKS